MRNYTFTLIFLMGMTAFAEAPKETHELLTSVDGKIYPLDQLPSECKDLLHHGKCEAMPFGRYHLEVSKDGDLIYSNAVVNDPESIQVREQSWSKDGQVKRASLENNALKKTFELEVKNGKVFYKSTDHVDRSVKTSESTAEDSLVVPTTLMMYIRRFESALNAGKSVDLKVAVLERLENYSFEIKKIRDEKTTDGEDLMVLQMTPTSFFVKAAIKPMFFYVKTSSGEIFSFEGKSALRRKDGDHYKELMVRVLYQYNLNRAKVLESTSGQGVAGCSEDKLKMGGGRCVVPNIKAESSSK